MLLSVKPSKISHTAAAEPLHAPHTAKVIKDAMGRDEAAKYPCETSMFSCGFMLGFDCCSLQKSSMLLVSSLLVLKSGANAGDQAVT